MMPCLLVNYGFKAIPFGQAIYLSQKNIAFHKFIYGVAGVLAANESLVAANY